MLLKTGVVHEAVQGPIWYACGVIESIYRANGVKFVITSLTDGQHKETSLHYKGLAVDVRTRNLPTGIQSAIITAVRARLCSLGFDVVFEADHLHVEYDPKTTAGWLGTTA